MTKLQQQIAELPDGNEVTHWSGHGLEEHLCKAADLKSLINELTEKVERYERMMALARKIQFGSGRHLSWMGDGWQGFTYDGPTPATRVLPTALEAFESLSK